MQRHYKLLAGLIVAFGVGFAASHFGIAAPAPPTLIGALVVFAMTAGYLGADRYLARSRAICRDLCGGPDGRPHGASTRSDAADPPP